MVRILGEDLDFDERQALKMATPFGGGLARFGMVCGALVGGAMLLGFRFGRTAAEEKEKKEKTYAKVQEMLRDFQDSFGSIQCRELIQLNFLDPADLRKYQEMNLNSRCARFVAKSAEVVYRLLEEK